MQNIENAIQELVTKQTLSLEAVDIVKKIKDDSLKLVNRTISLEKELSEVKKIRNEFEERLHDLRSKHDELEKLYSALKLRESVIREMELKCQFQTSRGDEIKELFMAVVKNPSIRKSTHQSGIVPVVYKDYNGGECTSSVRVNNLLNETTVTEE